MLCSLDLYARIFPTDYGNPMSQADRFADVPGDFVTNHNMQNLMIEYMQLNLWE